MEAAISFADESIQSQFQTDLKGNYQEKNVKTAVASLQCLQEMGWNLTEENLTVGLLNVVKNTGLLGRWQTLNESPRIICDTGHNAEGIKEIVAQLNELNYNRLHFVLGVVNDKSIDKILELLPKDAVYYLCQANIPRALDVDELELKFKKLGKKYSKCGSVKNALQEAKNIAKDDDLIFVGGSTFVVAEVL